MRHHPFSSGCCITPKKIGYYRACWVHAIVRGEVHMRNLCKLGPGELSNRRQNGDNGKNVPCTIPMELHNGHVESYNGCVGVDLHNSHVAQVRSGTSKKTLHYYVL
jgi:hypothetical protein